MPGITEAISAINARIDRTLVNQDFNNEVKLYICSELIELRESLLASLDCELVDMAEELVNN
jgi:RecA/RadA recombinase